MPHLPASELPPIERIPRELRLEIFRYILLSPDIRVPTKDENEDVPYTFSFRPAIDLQLINKNFSREVKDVLRARKFIKIAMKWAESSIVQLNLDKYDVPFFSLACKNPFQNAVAKVFVHSTVAQTSVITNFAVFLDDIPMFTRCLRMLDIENDLCLSLTFKLLGSPSLTTQRQILEPFELVDGVLATQEVLIAGNVDAELAARVRNNMTQTIGWLQVLAWNSYDLMVGLKTTADGFFNTGDFVLAAQRYRQATDFRDSILANRPYMEGYDENFGKAMLHIDIICTVNAGLSCLHGRLFRHPGEFSLILKDFRLEEDFNSLKEKAKARIAYVVGLEQLAFKRWEDAVSAFQWATERAEGSDKSVYRRCLLAARGYRTSSAHERSQDLEDLLKTIPKVPMATPKKIPYILPSSAADKYIMTKLGFTGIIPPSVSDQVKEGIVISLLGSPENGMRVAQVGKVYPTILDELAESLRRGIAESKRLEILDMKAWISLGADQIGSMSDGIVYPAEG